MPSLATRSSSLAKCSIMARLLGDLAESLI
jgi:hypothetical protein